MKREVLRPVLWGLGAVLLLGTLIVVGSRRLSHFDAVLVAYTSSILFATFGLTYRYAMWLQRPPTRVYWNRGWAAFFRNGFRIRNILRWPGRMFEDVLITRFIWTRNRLRGATHFLIMWGCILASLITFPLVFGWLHFESIPERLDWYRVFFFGFPGLVFPVGSALGFLLFHGLVWASFLVIAGVMLAMRRRMKDEAAAALQLFDEDFLPLILLFAVSLTGLMLTASYSWLKGYGYDFIGLTHAVTVIVTFLWLPFGKLFHIFQRPAQVGVRFYKDVGEREEPARCRRCEAPFSSTMHVQDLIQVERELGYRYEIPDSPVEHYQWICPPCRRALLALAQGRLWRSDPAGFAVTGVATTPIPANPAIGEGPLGVEDARNFHP